MSARSSVLHWYVWGPVHQPWAPHWVPNSGSHGFTTPFGRSGSCSGPTVVDKRLKEAAFGIIC